jgi:peptidyl-prolyl cis-trans isomerase C
MLKRTAAAWLAALALLPGCPKKEAPAVAVVAGAAITRDEFEDELRRVKSETGDLVLQKDVVGALKASVLNQLIEKKLVLSEAAAYNIGVTDAEVEAQMVRYRADYPGNGFDQSAKENFVNLTAWRQRMRERLIMDKVVHEAVEKTIEPDDEEINRYFRAHAGDFALEERVHLRQLVVRTRDEAEALRARILSGEPFPEVARKHSLTPDADEGGDVGTFAKGEMPPEFNIAFNLPVGEVSSVVQSSYGFHLFWVVEKFPARIPQFEDVRVQVRERLLQERKENAYRLWLKHLRDQAGVRIYQDEVDKVN